MLQLVLVAAGGAIGALSRYAADRIALVAFGSAVPGTLFVNASGSFILGLFTGYLVQNPEVPAHWKLFFAVGLLGSYTTKVNNCSLLLCRQENTVVADYGLY